MRWTVDSYEGRWSILVLCHECDGMPNDAIPSDLQTHTAAEGARREVKWLFVWVTAIFVLLKLPAESPADLVVKSVLILVCSFYLGHEICEQWMKALK